MYLQDITAHVQLSKGFLQALCLHDNLVDHLGAGEVKIQSLIGILCVQITVSKDSSFFETGTQSQIYPAKT